MRRYSTLEANREEIFTDWSHPRYLKKACNDTKKTILVWLELLINDLTDKSIFAAIDFYDTHAAAKPH